LVEPVLASRVTVIVFVAAALGSLQGGCGVDKGDAENAAVDEPVRHASAALNAGLKSYGQSCATHADCSTGWCEDDVCSYINLFYAQEYITSIAGRAFANSDVPAHLLNMSVFNWSAEGVTQSAFAWNLGDFTGATSPSPLSQYQRGAAASWYGSAAVQMAGYQSGCQHHTWSIPRTGNLTNCQLKYKWTDEDNKRPWAHETSRFKMGFEVKIPVVYREGNAVAYVYASIAVTDSSTGKSFWIQPSIYDTRVNSAHDVILWDSGTGLPQVGTYYRCDGDGVTAYVTKNRVSACTTGSTFSDWRWYGFSIDRAQLLNAINGINQKYGYGLSVNPADYRLALATIQNEVSWPGAADNAHIATAFNNLWVFEKY
jgi:hypothetical protein